MKKITFSQDTKTFILDSFDKTIDSEGYIVEKNNPTQRVITQDGQEIHINQFAGIRKGSQIFIKSDLISLIKLYDSMQ